MVSFREYIRAYLNVMYQNAFGAGVSPLPAISEVVSLLHRTMNAHGVYAPESSQVSVSAVYPDYDSVYYRAIFRLLSQQFVASATLNYSAPDIATPLDSADRTVPSAIIVPQDAYPVGFSVEWRTVQLPAGGV